jgi:RNA polymerase sigma factor (sigma-70 family)
MLMEVPEDSYKAFYKRKRREKYLKDRSKDNSDFSYDMLTTDEFNGEDILTDETADTQGEAERNLLLDKLRIAVLQLSMDDQELIALHFQQGISQVDIARTLGINQSNVSRKINKIVEKLRFLMKI